ncbi:hypothetical protein ACP70R_007870 [Stipagrostis hirtigluma subsp. patula]
MCGKRGKQLTHSPAPTFPAGSSPAARRHLHVNGISTPPPHLPTSSSKDSHATGAPPGQRQLAAMELAVGASAATIKSLLTKLGGLLAEEYALIREVRGDIQFITDELSSMQAFLSNLARAGGAAAGGGHDDQTKDWMKQVRDVSYDIEDCVDDFAHTLCPDHRGAGWLAAVRRVGLNHVMGLSMACACRVCWSMSAFIVDLKARAQQVGERYGVRDPEPGKIDGVGAEEPEFDVDDEE